MKNKGESFFVFYLYSTQKCIRFTLLPILLHDHALSKDEVDYAECGIFIPNIAVLLHYVLKVYC